MKNVRMMAWISIFIMLAACDFVDPHTLNIDVKKNEAGPTSKESKTRKMARSTISPYLILTRFQFH
jgi:hypothetical protein